MSEITEDKRREKRHQEKELQVARNLVLSRPANEWESKEGWVMLGSKRYEYFKKMEAQFKSLHLSLRAGIKNEA